MQKLLILRNIQFYIRTNNYNIIQFKYQNNKQFIKDQLLIKSYMKKGKTNSKNGYNNNNSHNMKSEDSFELYQQKERYEQNSHNNQYQSNLSQSQDSNNHQLQQKISSGEQDWDQNQNEYQDQDKSQSKNQDGSQYQKEDQFVEDEDEDEQFPMKLPFPITSEQLQNKKNNNLHNNKQKYKVSFQDKNRTSAYELTFKKQLNFQNTSNFTSPKQQNQSHDPQSYHRSNQISMMNKKLFKSQNQQIYIKNYGEKDKTKKSNIQQEQYQLSELPSDLQSLLNKPLNYFYTLQIQVLQNLPFFQMESCILSESQTVKKNIIGEVLQVKRLKMKLHSAQINHNILSQKKQKNIEQKHKQYLYSLLKVQLNKKLFIQCLRLNVLQNALLKSEFQQQKQIKKQLQFKKNKDKSIKQDLEKDRKRKHRDQQKEERKKNQKLKGDESFSVQNKNKMLQDSFQLEQTKAKCTIFGQILNTIFSRQVYRSFHRLVDYRKLPTNQRKRLPNQNFIDKNAKYLYKEKSSQLEQNQQEYSSSQDISSKQNQLKKYLFEKQMQKNFQNQQQQAPYADQQQMESHHEQEYSHQGQEQSLSDQQKIKELMSFIQQLQNQLENTDSKQYLKAYFLKWKIFYLNSILQEFLQNDEDEDKYHQEASVEGQQQSFSSMATSGVCQSIIQNAELINEHQNVQTGKSLKRQKKYLKYFLFRQNAFKFFDRFKEKMAQDKLKKICKMLYQENLLKRALKGFYQNVQCRKDHQQMEAYYQEIANQQVEQDTTYDMFHRTTLIARYFFNLKNTWKSCKIIKLLEKATLKLSLIKIANFSNAQRKKQFNIQRFIQISNSKHKFRAFQGWKQKTLLDERIIKAKRFRELKNLQIVKYHFSIFQLFYKKSLIHTKKAVKYHKNQQLSKVFGYLKFLSEQNRQINDKSEELKDYLTFTRGKWFMRDLTNHYTQSLLYQRIKIKQKKLKTNLDKSFIIERLKSWQTLTIKKQSYRAIQYRLIRLRQKQVKGKMLKIWYDQLIKAQQRKQQMDQSSQHKDWLVKYYGDLCSLVKQ